MDVIKSLDVGRRSPIFRVGPQFSHVYSPAGKAEGDFDTVALKRRWCPDGAEGRRWPRTPTCHRHTPRNARDPRGQERILRGLRKESGPDDRRLEFAPVMLISNFRPERR